MMLAGVGTLFICGGIQGYQAFVGDLRKTGALEWPMRVLLVIGGFVIATPGRRHQSAVAGADHVARCGDPAADRPAGTGAVHAGPTHRWFPPEAKPATEATTGAESLSGLREYSRSPDSLLGATISMNSPTGGAAAQPEKIVVTDPHIEDTGLSEFEVTRIRSLQGVWRWALLAATLATILLCMNQQFALRFLIGYTQLNTEYFYLLIALMLPFTFLIFPGMVEGAARSHALVRRRAVRVHVRRVALPDVPTSAPRPRTAGNSAARRPASTSPA